MREDEKVGMIRFKGSIGNKKLKVKVYFSKRKK